MQTQRVQTQFVTQPARLAWEDHVQVAADVLGLIPVLNIPAEIVSGLLSLRRKDYVGFGLSVAGLVPLQGEAAVALKLARTAQQIAKQGQTYRIAPESAQESAQAV